MGVLQAIARAFGWRGPARVNGRLSAAAQPAIAAARPLQQVLPASVQRVLDEEGVQVERAIEQLRRERRHKAGTRMADTIADLQLMAMDADARCAGGLYGITTKEGDDDGADGKALPGDDARAADG